MKPIIPKLAPHETAKEAGLRYTSDLTPGITRSRKGKGFVYHLPDGEVLKDKSIIQRIKSLGIPPAYNEVWICTDPNGHLQATGRDARGRKQYRYHPKWRSTRDENKYGRMVAFGHALPKIRKRITEDLKLSGLKKEKVLATVVSLLEKTLIRVGNEEYAKTNNSYGLTTMRDKHVNIDGQTVTFEFKGKSGVKHAISLEDPRLAKIIEKCQELPGYDLFQYIDEGGNKQSIGSSDVNAYLKEITGDDFTAKDFRTWYGTVLAAEALKEFEKFDNEAQAKKNITQAIENVSQKLGNTKAICRKCYVHPEILDSYMDGSLVKQLQSELKGTFIKNLKELKPEEASVVIFLQKRLEEKAR
jgi:DNA topoisomerase-1